MDKSVMETEPKKPEDSESAVVPIPEYVKDLVTQAKRASGKLASLSTAVKNQALLAMAEALEAKTSELLEANQRDLDRRPRKPWRIGCV
jgi:glutamate-5-semialdehyde dehydrogenase